MGAAMIGPLIGAVGSIASSAMGSGQQPAQQQQAIPPPETPEEILETAPPEPAETTDVLKEAETLKEAQEGERKTTLTSLRIKRTPLGTTEDSGLNIT